MCMEFRVILLLYDRGIVHVFYNMSCALCRAGQLEDSITRHLYALMASSALAGAVTIIVIIADSDDI